MGLFDLRGDSGNSQMKEMSTVGKIIVVIRGIRYAHRVVIVYVPLLTEPPTTPPR